MVTERCSGILCLQRKLEALELKKLSIEESAAKNFDFESGLKAEDISLPDISKRLEDLQREQESL